MSKILLQFKNFTAVLGRKTILERIQTTVSSGEIIGVVGANGAGKTSLLRSSMGLIPAIQGEVLVTQIPSSISLTQNLANHFAYAPQNPHSTWDFTIEELGQLSPQIDLFEEWTRRFALREKKSYRLSALSGGERKIAHLCLTFSLHRNFLDKCVILDEPTAALDFCRAELVTRAIKEMADQGAGVLVATHDLSLAYQCHELTLLKAGENVAHGKPREVLTPTIIQETWGVPVKL
jgi:iron complex transport system ATP-binding protein